MKNLEDLTTEVAPNSLTPLQKKEEIKAQDFINRITDIISRDFGDKLLEGKAKQGNKSPESLIILRDILFKEIESLTFSKNEDNNIRLATNQIKKTLKSQVDNILAILEQSSNKQNNYFYLLGQTLQALDKSEL